FMQALEFPLTF
nr:immunoglobulin light chain junction region [Macaca mulatta]